MSVKFNNVQIDLGRGYTLSLAQHVFDDGTDASYSHKGVTCEVAIIGPDGEFVPLSVSDDVRGWVDGPGLAGIIEEFLTHEVADYFAKRERYEADDEQEERP